uniref:Uncharacterized protein n=1 Tax=Cacopsylla melanoneura TaxID=428564 RepID=A0A8D8ZDJ4_9HEMI
MTEDELRIRRDLYQTKYPGRRLLVDIWIPGLDETEYCWAYVALFLAQAYIAIVCFMPVYAGIVTLLPIIMIHVEGQTKFLCKHIELLGHPHKDLSTGNTIFYTDFVRNQYVTASKSLIKTGETTAMPRKEAIPDEVKIFKENQNTYHTSEVKILRKNQLRKLRAYERAYFRQLVIFHQKMLFFGDQVCTHFP